MSLTFIAQTQVFDGMRVVEPGEEFEIPDGQGFPPAEVAIPKDKKAAAAAKKALDKSGTVAADEPTAPSTPAEAAVVAAAGTSQSSHPVI